MATRVWDLKGTSTTAGTTIAATTLTGTDYPQVGDWVIVAVAADNASASTPNISSTNLANCDASTFNTGMVNSPTATANGGTITLYAYAQVSTNYTSGTTISLTLSASTTAKVIVAGAISGTFGGVGIIDSSSATGATSRTVADTVQSGGALIGIWGSESNVAMSTAGITGADRTIQTFAGASAAAGQSVTMAVEQNTGGSSAAVSWATTVTDGGCVGLLFAGPPIYQRVAIAAPRNGTTAHNNISPSSGTVASGALFTPTAGRLLVCLIEGAATSTQTAGGWTLPTGGSAVNNSGLYLFHKTATGSDSISVSHNGSNYPIIFHFIEYGSDYSFNSIISATGVAAAGGAGPTLTGLTGTNFVLYTVGQGNSNASVTRPITWSKGTEMVDVSIVASGTDGYTYSTAYEDVYTSATANAAATSGETGITTERFVWAVKSTGVVNFDRTATLSATADITADGTVDVGVTNFDGTATLAATSAVTAAGVRGNVASSTLSATAAITTTGVVGKSTGATLSATDAITTAGVVARSASASLSSTASITTAGAVVAGSQANVAATDTITAAGTVATSTGATLAATDAITTAGFVASTTTASLAATGTITAAGSVVSGSGGSATLSATDTVTTAGFVGKSSALALAASVAIVAAGVVSATTGATSSSTATITAAGTVATSSGATLAATDTITATGATLAAGSGSALLSATDTITAVGTMASAKTASSASTVSITAVGVVGKSSASSLPAVGTITATSGALGKTATATTSGTASIAAAGTIATSSTATLAATANVTASGVVALDPSTVIIYGRVSGRLYADTVAGSLRVDTVTGALRIPTVSGGIR